MAAEPWSGATEDRDLSFTVRDAHDFGLSHRYRSWYAIGSHSRLAQSCTRIMISPSQAWREQGNEGLRAPCVGQAPGPFILGGSV
jgi:hypothetical protein